MKSIKPSRQPEHGVDSVQDLLSFSGRLRSVICSLYDIVLEIDENGVFTDVWTEDDTKLFMPRDQLLGQNIPESMGPLAGQLMDAVGSAMERDEAVELIYPHLDPRIDQWFKARVKRVDGPDSSGPRVVIGIVDISRQQNEEIKLRDAKKRLELNNRLLDVSQELSQTAGWEFNTVTNEFYWTKQMYSLFDMSEEFQPTYAGVAALFDLEDLHVMEDAVAKKEGFDLELAIHTSGGEKRWFRSIGRPVIEDDILTGMRGALMDITSRKEAELVIIEAKNIAETASKTKSDFLSIMSHEIRTPLNGIIGIANLLKLNHTVDQKEYVGNLIFSADHLLELINDILDLTKMENDKLELIPVEVNLPQLVRNIRNQFKSLAEAKGIRLVSFVDDDIPLSIVADPIRIGQILNNLISNAIKFTEQGEITVTIKLLSITQKTAEIDFRIKDTGIGIPAELQDTIFESFRQVQQSPYRNTSGTGLGLAISQKLARLHQSMIHLDSTPGVGSEFYFRIQFDIADAPSRSADNLMPSLLVDRKDMLKGLRVLLVEDNPINVLVAKKQLEYFGVSLDCVYSGREGLAMLKASEYDVALLDLHMPEIDGYRLAEIIRSEYQNTHIVIFTADIMMEVKVRLSKMEVYDILGKPFAPEKMFEVLLNVARARNLITG